MVSPGSVERDYHDKYLEYQQFGVREYWLLDYRRREVRCHQLNEKGEYVIIEVDAEGNYRSLVLPGLVLHVPTLWQEQLPGPIALAKLLESAMKSDTQDKE
ncbi:MAG: Uma2 family endonuclease [Chloroflexota bacterium]|nr:Uma2 family endonuclease [Chloroflexota bacterium]